MKNSFIFCVFFSFIFDLSAQPTNVFLCSPENSTITQTEFTNSEATIFKNCILFESDTPYEANPLQNKTFTAHNEIHIKSDFHDKAESNKTHHYVTNKADFEVAITNYWNSDLVFKYDKLEIGFTLPNSVQEKMDAFFAYFENVQANNLPYNPDQNDPTLLNPFLDWDIKVETYFTHIETGFQKTIFGFYYQDFERDFQNEEWDEVATPYPFLTRYAPPKNGKWQAITKITIEDGAEVYLSDPYFFTVIESGQHGFVKVHENKRNLKLEDRMIMPVGHNLGWAGFWVQEPNKLQLSTFKHWDEFRIAWENYKNTGSRFARTHLHNGIMDIEWEYVGNYKNRLHYAWELDKLVDFWEHNDMLVQLTLMMQHQLAQTDMSRFRLDYNPYSKEDEQSSGPGIPYDPKRGNSYALDLGIESVVDFMRGETNNVDNLSHKFLKQRLRYLISRYCYSTSISQLDINSEINLAIGFENLDYNNENGVFINGEENTTKYYNNSIETREAIFTYNKAMSEYIKYDLNHTEHLLSVNYSDWPFEYDTVNNVITEINNKLTPDNTFSLATIDVIGLNTYSNHPDKLFKTNVSNYFNYISLATGEFGLKPIVLGEVGSADVECWNDLSQMNVADLMTLGFTGIAGFNTWNGVTDDRVFSGVKRASDHMNGDDVISTLSDGNGEWTKWSERNDHDILTFPNEFPGDYLYQHFYYKSANREKIVGFVKNNTYNFFNYGFSPCNASEEIDNANKFDEIKIRSWNENDFYLMNLLENHNFKIHYYTFNNYLSSDCFNTSINGHQKLQHPISGNILWYVAYVEDCMNGMVLQNDAPNELESILSSELLDSNTLKNDHIKSTSILSKSKNNDKVLDNDIVVIPNPTSHTITIRSSSKSISKIKLLDLKGGIIFNDLLDKLNQPIDISFLSSGVYLIKIEETNKFTYKKIVKL